METFRSTLIVKFSGVKSPRKSLRSFRLQSHHHHFQSFVLIPQWDRGGWNTGGWEATVFKYKDRVNKFHTTRDRLRIGPSLCGQTFITHLF